MNAATHSWRNSLCVMLVAAAVLLRVIVPSGWMLEQDASGGFTIEICNSDAKIIIPMKNSAPDHGEEEIAAKACSFASLQDNATTPDLIARLPLSQLAEAAYDAVRERALSPTTPRILPPARAPPLTV